MKNKKEYTIDDMVNEITRQKSRSVKNLDSSIVDAGIFMNYILGMRHGNWDDVERTARLFLDMALRGKDPSHECSVFWHYTDIGREQLGLNEHNFDAM